MPSFTFSSSPILPLIEESESNSRVGGTGMKAEENPTLAIGENNNVFASLFLPDCLEITLVSL